MYNGTVSHCQALLELNKGFKDDIVETPIGCTSHINRLNEILTLGS